VGDDIKTLDQKGKDGTTKRSQKALRNLANNGKFVAGGGIARQFKIFLGLGQVIGSSVFDGEFEVCIYNKHVITRFICCCCCLIWDCEVFPDLAWPKTFLGLARLLSVFNLAIFQLPVLSCAMRFTFFDEFLVMSCAPLLFLFVLLLANLLGHYEWPFKWFYDTRCAGWFHWLACAVVFLLYPQVSNIVLQMLHCKEFHDGSRYLVSGEQTVIRHTYKESSRPKMCIASALFAAPQILTSDVMDPKRKLMHRTLWVMSHISRCKAGVELWLPFGRLAYQLSSS
jgi:hypothetical protein